MSEQTDSEFGNTARHATGTYADALFENIPNELKEYPQWICFRLGPVKLNGKRDKLPIDPRTGTLASVSDARTWGPFDDAVKAFVREGYDGIGFVFTENDPFTGIDLDECRDPHAGHLAPRAADIVEQLDSYTEASPSGGGVHTIVKAKLPGGGGQYDHIEMYDRRRFFTFTGEHLGGTPTTVEERQDAVSALYKKYFQREEHTQHHKQRDYSDSELEDIKSALQYIPAVDYDIWLKVGMALHHVDPGEMGFGLFDHWSQTCPEKYTRDACQKKWHSFHARVDGITEKTIFEYAIRYGWRGNIHADNGTGSEEQRQSQQSSPFVVLDLEEFFRVDTRPREHVLAPILSTQGLAMVHAYRGVGKTLCAVGMAYAVASGSTFLRWTAPTPRKVLYVDGELPATVLRERLLHVVTSADAEPPRPDFFRVFTPDVQEWGRVPNLATLDGQQALAPYLDGVELLVLDNLSTLCANGEENAAESWLPIQEWILSLRRRGMAVLMVHHSGKGGAQRGTSKREDVLDTVISLRHPRDYSPEQGARFEVHFEKSRGVQGDPVKPFVASVATVNEKQVWIMKELEMVLLEQVITLHKDGLKQRDIAAELKISLGKVNKLLKQARAEGKI